MLGRKGREKAAKARERITTAFRKLPRFNNKTSEEVGKSHSSSTSGASSNNPDDVTTELRVSIIARFEAPLDKNFNSHYETSPGFEVTDKLCNALLRRIEHGTRELITRPDAGAFDGLRHTEPRLKLARFHLNFRIDRRGKPWAERFFTSFQDVVLGLDAAHKVVLEADRLICQFLCAHDTGFTWELPSFVAEDPLKQITTSYEVGAPQTIQCVPSYWDTPGYSINITVRICCRGQIREWKIKINSQQPTPLTLHAGENLMSQISSVLCQVVKDQEDRFNDIHQHCETVQGPSGCEHFEENAFDLVAEVRNNLGPDYNHFSTRFQSFRLLLNQVNGPIFVQDLEKQLMVSRNLADEIINNTNDIVLQIHDLHSKDWKVYHPLSVSIDPSVLHCRKTTERILERVQSGMVHILRGHGTVATLTLHKRGHLILNTSVCRGEDTDFYDIGLFDSLNLKKRVLQKRMSERISDDIAMVCKDTISIETPEELPELKICMPDDLFVEPLNARARALRRGSVPIGRRISKKSPLLDLRRRSLEEAEAGESLSSHPEAHELIFKDYSYMADMVSERSESPRVLTPSLADTASDYLQDGAETPRSARATSGDFSGSGLAIANLDQAPMRLCPSVTGEFEGSSTGTIVRSPKNGVKHATTLLASYWEHSSTDASQINDKTTTSSENVLEAAEGVEVIDQSAKDSSISPSSSGISETAWLANKPSFGAKGFSDAATIENGPLPEAITRGSPATEGGRCNGSSSIPEHKLSSELTVSGQERKGGLSKSQTMPALLSRSRVGSRALIVRDSGRPLNCFPRRSSAEAAPAYTFVHAQGRVHKRQFSSPAGGHLGLHGEWVIEMGLRNALVPPHLRTSWLETIPSNPAATPPSSPAEQSSNWQ